ncbi:MAG: SDR family NAD(P)-dependent oxidoreductase [Gammaproteobacteria bacterium]
MKPVTGADSRIAVIGMAFRFPGDLSDEQGFWAALQDGRDLVTRIGAERWATDLLQHPKRSEAGRSVSFSAGVLSRVDQFDAEFFGISPREAAWLDPQQRLLLELSWEAMENGGLVPASLAGANCAVYVGISGVDYGIRVMDDLAAMTAYSMTGNTLSNAANRLSYAFDLRGPSVAVDTACSSSLVALHHACSSLLAGETSLALVGGVNLLLHPYPFVGFTKASMLSANGRCRAFDASGDGYVRAEGGVVLMLKPLDKALADGDAVQAVILATGTNADGGRKAGFTIPSSAGQVELMRAVLGRSGLASKDVDYIEAHGTGTAVGDPVEAAAIGEVYGRCRAHAQPLPIGSVKTNLGHMEPASGLAGLIKAVLVLKNRALPPSLHLATPNPHIDFAGLNLDVVSSYRALPTTGRRLLVAGVNSFGFGGTNAHVLLQEFRAPQPRPQSGRPKPPLILSARTAQALCDLAGRYAELIKQQPDAFYDIAYAAAYRRNRMEKRLALTNGDPAETAEQLVAFSQGGAVARLVLEDALAQPGGVAFIYSGNGAQWLGMGRRLMAESPRFSELISELDTRICAVASFSIIDELRADAEKSRLDDTAVAQPLLFAIQVALTTLLRDRGIEAQAVAGHSVGEVAAAWAAGILNLDQAVQVICVRSEAQAATRGCGRMAAVGLSEDAARQLIVSEHLNDIEIAGINSPSNITVSGALAALERLEKILVSRDVFYRLLDLDYAFHARAMDAIEDELTTRLADLVPLSTTAPIYVSTVKGEVMEGAALDGRYWWHNVRHPVRFAQAMSTLVSQGCRVFIEIGPHAILQRYINECVAAQGIAARVLPMLWRDDDGLARVEEIALRVHLVAESPRLEVFFPAPGGQVRLPNYPWQRERHWHPSTSDGYGLLTRQRVHPLLGWRLKDAPAAWENILDLATYPWLADHKVAEAIVLPGAAYVEMALAAAREYFGGTRYELEQLDILVPVVFDSEHARSLRFELATRDGVFQIRSRQRLSEDEWTLHATGRLLSAHDGVAQPSSVIQQASDAPAVMVIDRATHYRLTSAIGLNYGPAFQGLERAEVAGQILQASIVLPASVDTMAAQFLIHPAALDICFQSLVDFFHREIDAGLGVLLLPVKVGRLRYYHSAPIVGFRARLGRRSARSALVDFELFDAAGNIVVALADCRFRAAAVQRRSHEEPTCWKILPHLRPLAVEQRESRLPSGRELAKQLSAWFTDAENTLQRSAYFEGALPLFEALTVAFARDAFQDLFARRGDWLQKALTQPALVDASIRPLFVWIVRVLQQDNLLIRMPTGDWRLEVSDLPAAHNIWRTLLRDYPASLPELVFAARVGRHLSAVLGGEMDARVLAEGLRRSHQLESLFNDSPAYLGSRLAVAQILRIVAADWPTQRRLRVLEIDVGESGLARQLIPVFSESRLDYVIAHADDEVRARLQAEYAGYPSVIVARLDEDGLNVFTDGALPEHFDIIILRHWLHRSPHPADLLTAARRKLTRGGLLVLAERHPDFAADFVAGLDPQWWGENLEGRSVSRLMPPQVWEHRLTEQAFVDIEIFREPAGEDLFEGAYLLLAKRPGDDVLSSVEPAMESWLLICDTRGPSRQLSDRLQRLLESYGQRVTIAAVSAAEEGGIACGDLQDPTSVETLLTVARVALGKIAHVVYLSGWTDRNSLPEEASLTGSNADTAVAGLEQSQGKWSHDRVTAALHLVQAIGRVTAPPRLWLVTTGGALADGLPNSRSCDPLQAAVWGFGRVVMNEYPGLDCTLIDLDIDPTGGAAADRLRNELLHPDGEKEIVLSTQGRFVLRIERALCKAQQSADETAARFRLDFRSPGQLRNLVWLPQIERPLAEDEIEVRVVAAGLNFRDVMYLMGLLPDEAVESGFAGATLGLEFAGVVTRVGKRIDEIVAGDAVMGFGPACFASHVITKATAVTHKPADWSFAAATTVPTVFFTVYYALKHLANMQPGERVLIHGAAGGVGIAAVQLALHLGAEVFATAGSDEKRDFVKLLGADHVFDSRSMAFADEILAATDGAGVDVILNSLAGEAIRRNLRILKPFGRFLELGKRDFFENTPIGLRPFKDNISYFGIDADQLLIARPALAAQLFREVMILFRNGVLFPLPYRIFPADHVIDAFRTMQQARQIGKVVVTFEGVRVAVEPAETAIAPLRLKQETSWLVTGGLAGFGLESARWLAERGAGHLVLAGRRGVQTPGALDAVRELEALGAQVKVVACDIADRAAVQAMLVDIRRTCPRLAGVLHAAMVLDDTLIANLDAERLRKVLAPKLLGACHLHSLTLDIPLEYFVLYSSITTFIGNPGQANYVAANAALESLADLRRTMGLPAICIGWGPIADAGYLTRNQAVKDSLTARLGAAPLNARDALAVLDQLLASDTGITAVANIDWSTLLHSLPSAQGPRFETLRRQVGPSADAGNEGENIHAMIVGKSAEEVRDIVQSMIAHEVAQILCIGIDRIDPARSLHDLGMDSLMAVELALGLEARFGIQLPAMMLSEGPTVERVAARIVERILGADDQDSGSSGDHLDAAVNTLAAQHGEDISADELIETAKQVRNQVRDGARSMQ